MRTISQFERTIALTVAILLAACGKSEQTSKDETDERKMTEQLEAENEKNTIDIAQKYNAISLRDSLKDFTCDFQEEFIDKKKSVCFEGELEDITKTDSVYYLKIRASKCDLNRNFIAIISMSSANYSKLREQLNSTDNTKIGSFIFNVSKICSPSSQLKSDLELAGEDSYSYLYYDIDETLLILEGDLIDFCLNKTSVNKMDVSK